MNHHGMRRRARNLGASLHGLAFLALLALIQACECDPADPGDGIPYRIRGQDMGAMFQNLVIFRDDQPFNDAAVTVNGVEIAHTTDEGLYQGQLPHFLPAGSPLELEVSAGDATVRGTGKVPESPVVTGPASGSVFAPTDMITVSWTSATTPDRFVVVAQWVVGEAGTGKDFPALATARSLAIAASELPSGPEVTLAVFAYNDGSFTGPITPDSRMSIRGPSSKSVITVGSAAMPFEIRGQDMGAKFQNIYILRDGQPVDAAVTVNGVALAPSSTDSGFYQGQLPQLVPVGAPLELEVNAGGATVRGTGKVPEAPAIIAPATGSTFASTDTITVRWTSATTPDRFMVVANWPVSGGHGGKFFVAPAAARSLEIAASELPPGSEVMLEVLAYNDGSFTGPVTPNSRMSIRGANFASKVVFTIAP